MEESLDEYKEPRKPPSIGAYVAVLLELSMLGVFAYEKSVMGLVLWFGYLRFSATWSFLLDLYRNK